MTTEAMEVVGDNDDSLMNDKATVAPAPSKAADQSVVFSPELLQMYYSRLFPFSMLHSWLSYCNGSSNKNNIFKNREFSFTLQIDGEEIYIRHQSFADQTELAAAILKRRPVKIDIGAVYQAPPSDKHAIQTGQNAPDQRELVFDIDLTDYDGIRQCGCSGAQICHKCWEFMKVAVKVMDKGLREDFGFQHIAWFYSGRRGVHAWVCDEAARALTDEGRSAVAHYFEVSHCRQLSCCCCCCCCCCVCVSHLLVRRVSQSSVSVFLFNIPTDQLGQ